MSKSYENVQSKKNANMINRKKKLRKLTDIVTSLQRKLGDSCTITDIAKCYLEFDDEELTWQHAQENFEGSTLDNLLDEIDTQKEFRARKKKSPKVVFRPEATPLVPKLPMDFPTRSNDPIPIRRREASLRSSVDEDERILGSKDCHKLENLISHIDGANTISSAKQCTKSMLDRIAENQIRDYLNRRDREITVGAIPKVQTTSITPPSEGMIATQVLDMSFAIVVEQLKTMDPGPHFYSRNQGRISGAAALARALNLVNSDHYRQAILRLPLDQQWAALVITGALASDY